MHSPVRALIIAVVALAITAPAVLAGAEFVGTWKGYADGTEVSFNGTLQDDGSVTGTYTQMQTSGSFSMKLAEPAQEE